jgi:LacI family transcriptional regulator
VRPLPSTPATPAAATAATATLVLPATSAQPRRLEAARRDTSMRHVALLIESSGSYGRGLIQGIARYHHQHAANWSIYFRPHGLADPPPTWLSEWSGDGILARLGSRSAADIVRRTGAAVVNLRGTVPDLTFPYVTVDNAGVANLAAQHLLERGVEHFAFCGRPRGINPSLDQRSDAFKRAIERSGNACHAYPPAPSSEPTDWETEQERLTEWLRRLPKPIGVMACNDERGLQVLDACRRCGVAVPDEVAVVGVDNDPTLCELAIPPLSSVDVNAEGIGYEAAALLDRMMGGAKAPARAVKVVPRGVVTRRSTDLVASEDEELNRAIRYIRENACRGLQVMDVLRFMGMSRAPLQQRMKQLVGRTLHQEIQHVRIGRAKELLSRSRLTIKQVARESGFASVQYMTRLFRAVTGETPARYRLRRAV